MYDHIRVYYGVGHWPSEQIPGPAPLISITYNPYFAGDNIIGYDYTVVLSGYATVPTGQQQPTAAGNAKQVITRTRELIETIFNKNGAVLLVQGRKDNGNFDADSQELLRAWGSKIISISLEPNDNMWTNYIGYTVELSFNEIRFYTPCEQGAAPTPDLAVCPNIVITNFPDNFNDGKQARDLNDIRYHKIKSFSDSWSFTVGDENYDRLGSALHNERFNITYTVTAQGFNYFVENASNTSNYNFVKPSWEQAKDFCQTKLYEQLLRLNNELRILPRKANSNDGRDPYANSNPETAFTNLNDTQDGIYSFPLAHYKVYNEEIDTVASEAGGTFTINYKAIVKRYNTETYGALPEDHDVIHTVNPSKKFTDGGSVRNISLDINGKIEGLFVANLVKFPVDYNLQQFKELLVANSTTGTKYDKAREYFKKIMTTNSSDFIRDYKDYYGITYDLFEVVCGEAEGPIPSSFNVTHNYSDGVIEYSASFDSARICSGYSNYTNIDMILTDKVEQVAEIVIPGRITPGALVQRLNTYTPRTLTVNITGRTNKDCCWDIATDYAEGVCDVPYVTTFNPRTSPNFGLDTILPPRAMINAVLTQDSNTLDPLTGSFSVTREYTFFDES